MASIDINLRGLDNAPIGSGGSSDFLHNVLHKLDSTIDKLNNNIQKFNSKQDQIISDNRKGMTAPGNVGRVSNEIGSTIGTALAVAVGASILRGFNNQANAIMGRATNAGGFMAAAIGGSANQAFGSYASNYINIEARRIIANNNAIAEGVGGVAGAAAGALGAGAFAAADPAAISGIKKTALAGGAIGAGVGDYMAAKAYNQYVQQKAMVQAAEVEKYANASVMQWKTGFNRFGLRMTNQQLLSGEFTGGAPINVPLSQQFKNMYGASQNYNAIQNNIVPYLPSNTNLLSAENSLARVAQNFVKAGFAVNDFGKLTLQSSQYQALTGKNIRKFSEDITVARYKFGDAYDANANQTALNLMQMGISQTRAEHLANQAIYNPGILSGVGMLANSTFSDYYKRLGIGNQLGLNLGATMATGHFVETRKGAANRIIKDISTAMAGDRPSIRLGMLENAGYTLGQLASFAQRQVAEGKIDAKTKADILSGRLSPAQAASYTSGTVAGLMQDVSNMTVNATGQVTIIAQNDIAHQAYNAISHPGRMAGGVYMQGNTLINSAEGMSPAKKH